MRLCETRPEVGREFSRSSPAEGGRSGQRSRQRASAGPERCLSRLARLFSSWHPGSMVELVVETIPVSPSWRTKSDCDSAKLPLPDAPPLRTPWAHPSVCRGDTSGPVLLPRPSAVAHIARRRGSHRSQGFVRQVMHARYAARGLIVSASRGVGPWESLSAG